MEHRAQSHRSDCSPRNESHTRTTVPIRIRAVVHEQLERARRGELLGKRASKLKRVLVCVPRSRPNRYASILLFVTVTKVTVTIVITAEKTSNWRVIEHVPYRRQRPCGRPRHRNRPRSHRRFCICPLRSRKKIPAFFVFLHCLS